MFLDELPWLATPRSGLLPALDHVWNTRLSRVPGLTMVLCGSAASWMLDKLVHARGGLHNRITRRMRLSPFTLGETKAYLEEVRGVRWDVPQLLELTMALGGVPHYLRQVRQGLSAAQNIAATCFDPNGQLYDEFPRLFASLFANSQTHDGLVRAIAKRNAGVSRDELIAATGLSTGGALGRKLGELEEAGFIARAVPYGRRSKGTTYRLIDEYSKFYLTWIESAPRGLLAADGAQHWLGQRQTPAYRAWAGFAFEALCLKHAAAIRNDLGIGSIPAVVSTWRDVPRARSAVRTGAQVDLLFDRADGVITLCEIKHASDDFVISKQYARALHDKIEIFRNRTGTRKQISLVLVTTHGLKRNLWSEDLIDGVVTADAMLAAATR